MRRDRVVFAAVEEPDVVHAVGVALVDRAREPGFATIPARLDGVADLISGRGRRRGNLAALYTQQIHGKVLKIAVVVFDIIRPVVVLGTNRRRIPLVGRAVECIDAVERLE